MSFFSKLKSFIVSMWHKAPAVEVAMASAVNYLIPFVESLDTIITPALAPELNPILDKIKVGLSALKATLQDATDATGKTNIGLIVASVNNNLTALVAAAQVKDAATAAKIQAVATLVTGELAAIAGA